MVELFHLTAEFASAGDTHSANLKRVSERLSRLVLDYCRDRLNRASRFENPSAAEFRMGDLTQFVKNQALVAPDSAGRILRHLRQRKLLGYTLLSRRDSLYRVDWVKS